MLMLDLIQIPELSPQTLNTFSSNLFHQLGNLGRNDVLVKAKVLVRILAWQALAKGAHAKARVGVALPSVDGVGFDDYTGSVGAVLENLALVGEGLGVEEALAGERDDAGFDVVFFFEDLTGLDREAHLGADADERDVGVVLFDEDICTLLSTVAAGVLGVLLEVLSRK